MSEPWYENKDGKITVRRPLGLIFALPIMIAVLPFVVFALAGAFVAFAIAGIGVLGKYLWSRR